MKITDVRIVIGAFIQVKVQLDRIGIAEKNEPIYKNASSYLEAFLHLIMGIRLVMLRMQCQNTCGEAKKMP